MDGIEFTVLGTPAPKGSSRAFVVPGTNRAVVAPSGSAKNKQTLRSWDQAVRLVVNEITRGQPGPLFVETPVAVVIVFRLARPSGHWGKKGLKPSAPGWPGTKPDLDKLARATCDSLHGTVYDDDSRIVHLTVMKQYAAPGDEGATISVKPIHDTQKGT
jgi:Holliday junction resolvase RusA-like endonuclease